MSVQAVAESFVNVMLTPLCPPALVIVAALTVICWSAHGEELPPLAGAVFESSLPVIDTEDAMCVDEETHDEATFPEGALVATCVDVAVCDIEDEVVIADVFDRLPHALTTRAAATAIMPAAIFVLELRMG